jgi:hypothetical protein
MEALMIEQDIETLIISAIRIPIAKELFVDTKDVVEHGDNDNDNKHDDIHSARSFAVQPSGLQLDDDDVEIEEDEDLDADEEDDKVGNEDEDQNEDMDADSELVDKCKGESSVEDMLRTGCDIV